MKNQTHKLVFKDSKAEVPANFEVEVHGVKKLVTGFKQNDFNPNSEGRVYVTAVGETFGNEYYPSVFGMKIVEL